MDLSRASSLSNNEGQSIIIPSEKNYVDQPIAPNYRHNIQANPSLKVRVANLEFSDDVDDQSPILVSGRRGSQLSIRMIHTQKSSRFEDNIRPSD
jgi:hypothetical protein